jgi:signal peptidase I
MRYDGRVKAWAGTGEWLGWLWREWLRPLLVVGIVLGSFRSAVADWNDVPSGSMEPTILPGDRVFVNKLAYDLKVPFTTWQVAPGPTRAGATWWCSGRPTTASGSSSGWWASPAT